MRLRCDIEIPDGADYKTKLDAMAEASRNESLWREVKTREERRDEMMSKTSLENKCGSCKFFELTPHKRCKSYGTCKKKGVCRVNPRPRSYPACTAYERKKDK